MNQSEMISLREHIEEVLRRYEKAHEREHQLIETSLDRAREVVDMRLASMNELRDQINTERGIYVQIAEYRAGMRALETRLSVLETAMANLQGRLTAVAAGLTIGLVVLQLLLQYLT